MSKFFTGLVLLAVMVPVFAGITYEAHGGWAVVWGGWTVALVALVFAFGAWALEESTEEMHKREIERLREMTPVLEAKRRAERGY